MSSEPALAVRGLCKNFRIYRRARHRLYELFFRRQCHRDFQALKDISFALEKGQIMGIIGENGSGKSTLLKLISQVLVADGGEISRNGKITGILELGAGFNPELSGRKNIALNGIYLGMDKSVSAAREREIIEFSELAKFIDEPLKSYSSGMAMRLAFAVAIHANPQCFIIDEALSVGDVRFQQKCFAKLREFRSNGGSILFVSHDMNAVKLLCDRAMLLHKGEMLYLGDPDEAVNRYNELMAQKGDSGALGGMGYGNLKIRFTEARALDKNGNQLTAIVSGQPMRVEFSWSCLSPQRDVSFGFMIRDRFGQDVFGTNGAILGKTPDIRGDGQGCFAIDGVNLGPGVYTVNLAAHTGTTHLENCFHWWDNALVFEVVQDPERYFGGHTRLEADLLLSGAGGEREV